jgi:enamine deaminase RidA (YjgF/YER057c/UK114 family)
MPIERWPSRGKGRSRIVTYGHLVWTVANAIDTSVDFDAQAIQSLEVLDAQLKEAGSARTQLLSLQVMLADIEHRGAFDKLWQEWIGPHPEHWPQRACFQSALAPGLLLELVAVAAPGSAACLREDEAFFRALELRRTKALVERDVKVLEELHAPEYELITPAGRVFDRKQYLDTIAKEPFYAGWDVGEMAFRISPGMAILRYKAKLVFPSGREVLCWHTDAYERRSGQWQAVWSQATELRKNEAL